MDKVVISNIYSPQNIGDRAIVDGVATYFKFQNEETEITYLSKYFYEFPNFTNWTGGKELIHLPTNKNSLVTFLYPLWSFVCFFSILVFYKINREFTLNRLSENSTFKRIAEASVVAAAGGNYLFSSNRSSVSRTMLVHLFNIYLPTLIGKKVVLFPQSIGPFYRKYEERALIKLINKSTLIMLRDSQSYQFLTKRGVSEDKLLLVPDIAFILPRADRKMTSQKKALVTALDWGWGVQPKDQARYDSIKINYKESLIKISKKLVDEFGFRVDILPHVTVSTSDDRIISREIVNGANNRNVQMISRSGMKLSDIIKTYSEYDLVIGTRMHSCILGISQGIPTIGIAYQPKTLGVFGLLNIDEYVVDANNFEYYQLESILELILNDFAFSSNFFQAKGVTARDRVYQDIRYAMNTLS